MLRSICLAFVAISVSAADPAVLHVQVHEDKYLTFSVEDKYASPITKFQVAVDFPGTGLSCGLTADVKRPEDLHPAGTCGLPLNEAAPVSTEWKARLVFVEFADGMRWTHKP